MAILQFGLFNGTKGLGGLADIQAMEGLEKTAISQLEFVGDMAAKHHLKVYDVRQSDADGGAWWFVGSDCCFHGGFYGCLVLDIEIPKDVQ
jgi:hypothetical protein